MMIDCANIDGHILIGTVGLDSSNAQTCTLQNTNTIYINING